MGSLLTSWPRRYPLCTFFALAFLMTWAYWIPRALVSRAQIDLALPEFLAIIAGYGPALASVIVTSAVDGRSGLRKLGCGLLRWRVGIQWYVVVLFLPMAQSLGALGLHLAFGGAIQRPVNSPTLLVGGPDTPLWLEILLLMLMFTVGFDGLGEELGWRGFALPRLMARYRALTASLVLGALWALWHLPYALTVGSTMSNRPFHHFLSHMFATAILFTWVFNNTRGSILLAVLFHAAFNVTVNVLPIFVPGVYEVGLWADVVRWAVVMTVVVVAGPAHLSRKIVGKHVADRSDAE